MYYYFLGQTLTWGAGELPPAIGDTYDEEMAIRNNIIYAKRINASDVCYVVERIDWVSGAVYDRFDANYSQTNLAASGASRVRDAKFYVLTPEKHVYKCIHNNYGLPSTVQPTGTDSSDVLETSDGYIWKYMYSIPISLQSRFLTTTHMPVLTSLQTRYYNSLGIDSVSIGDGGSGYQGGLVTTAAIDGDGSGAILKVIVNPTEGSIEKVKVLHGGSGYTHATCRVIDAAQTGRGKYGSNYAQLVPFIKDGAIDHVSVVDPGIGYSADVQTTIIVNGDGKEASLIPIVDDGRIIDVIVNDPGYGYTETNLVIESITGTGAELIASTAIGDIESTQSDVELLAVPGAVYVVDPVNHGYGYSAENTYCVVKGDGNGLMVKPVIVNGTIPAYTVESFGEGYTWCEITVYGDGFNATCKALLSPFRGHGHNAIEELYADTLSIFNSIRFLGTNAILEGNDYRQFGILKNPEEFSSTAMIRTSSATPCYRAEFNVSPSDFHKDQILVDANDPSSRFVVVSWDAKSVVIQSLGSGSIKPAMTLTDPDTGFYATVTNVEAPTFDKFSGVLIYVDNKMPVMQSTDQFVSLRTLVRF